MENVYYTFKLTQNEAFALLAVLDDLMYENTFPLSALEENAINKIASQIEEYPDGE